MFNRKQSLDCHKKTPYRTQSLADKAAHRKGLKLGRKLYIYKCPVCRMYHLTSKSHKQWRQEHAALLEGVKVDE